MTRHMLCGFATSGLKARSRFALRWHVAPLVPHEHGDARLVHVEEDHLLPWWTCGPQVCDPLPYREGLFPRRQACVPDVCVFFCVGGGTKSEPAFCPPLWLQLWGNLQLGPENRTIFWS